MRALAIAATGMSAQEQNLEVIANNIANINTTGFKRSRAEFTDLIYQTERLMGVSSRGRDATIPEGAQIGLGVRTAAIRSVDLQGALTNTGNTLDLAINGRGWFQVTNANGDTVYTRDGAFNTNQTGQLVTMDGYTVIPSILIPANATNLAIGQTGVVTVTVPGQATPQQLGQLTIANFVNDAGLQALGSNYFQQTAGLRPANRRRSRRHGVRRPSARLHRGVQRRSCDRDHQSDRGPARLRDELEGDPGGRSDVRDDLQHALVAVTRSVGLRAVMGHEGGAVAGLAVWTLLVLGALWGPVRAQEAGAPTPTAVIYPGDVIRDEMIADSPEGGVRDGGGPFIEDRTLVVGKVARLTLLPGHAIPYAGVSNRKLVANGAEVKLVYSDGGLLIMTTGAALQDGEIGDVVRVRNSDSGVTVSGAVQPDGSVKVGGG